MRVAVIAVRAVILIPFRNAGFAEQKLYNKISWRKTIYVKNSCYENNFCFLVRQYTTVLAVLHNGGVTRFLFLIIERNILLGADI